MKKYVIYIDFDETIDSLLEKIRISLDFKNKVFIFIPEESKIFDQKNSLEIFYEEIKKLKKEIILVSKNLKIFKIATNLKIPVQNILDENLWNFSNHNSSENIIKIKKVQKKWSEEIFYSFNNLKEKLDENWISNFVEEKKMKILDSYKINRKISLSLIFWTFFLIFWILILIIPNSKILIKPNSKEIKYTWNFIFAEEKSNKKNLENENNNFIWYQNVKKFYEKWFIINSNWKSFEWNFSKWIIEINNSYSQDLAIKRWSTLKTKNWLLFKTRSYVNIPAAKKISNWKIKNWKAKVWIIAEDFDVYHEIIWERWNIKKWTELVIPALSRFLSKSLNFKAENDFKWWTTKWRKLVTSDDIDVWKKIIRDKILKIAKKEIFEDLKEKNLKNWTNLKIFPIKKFFNINISNIEIPKNLIWQKLNNFTMTWTFLVNWIIYDDKILNKKLEQWIRWIVHPKMIISYIDWKNIWYRVFEVNEKSNQIKTTISISWREDYDLFWKTDSWKRFKMDIKDKVKNLDKKTALEYLRDFDEIWVVKIKIWPPFLNKLPKFEDWIKIIKMD